jgi:hypothetical protein
MRDKHREREKNEIERAKKVHNNDVDKHKRER